jgi:hypothetical protein
MGGCVDGSDGGDDLVRAFLDNSFVIGVNNGDKGVAKFLDRDGVGVDLASVVSFYRFG